MIWALIRDVDKFFESSARILRELFVHGASSHMLLRAANILQLNLNREGPRFGRMRAEKTLAREFPQILDYLDSKDPWNSARASAPPSN